MSLASLQDLGVTVTLRNFVIPDQENPRAAAPRPGAKAEIGGPHASHLKSGQPPTHRIIISDILCY
jgi:hypothetical protein